MSTEIKPVRVPDLLAMKRRAEKIVALTAYDFTMARILDRAGVDILLVGDSLGNVVLGHPTTLPVTMDDMVRHTAAVARGAARALVVADMPFLAAQAGRDEAVRNAGRLLAEGGAAAVKIEGGRSVAEVAGRLVEIGIPVMGHLGLTPQSVHKMGGYRRQATTEETAQDLLEQAAMLEAEGAFALVLESVPAEVARRVTEELAIPVIGIGAGPHCDGQVLVSYDVLGLTQEPLPSFVRPYARLGEAARQAAAAFCEDVRLGRFPAAQQEES